MSDQNETGNDYNDSAVDAMATVFFITVVISKTVKILNKILPYQKKTGTRLFIGVLTHFIISFLITVFFFYLYKVYFFEVKNFFEYFFQALFQ